MFNPRLLGIVWFMLSLLVSSFNDIVIKYVADEMPAMQIAFCRFFFATVVMLPLFFLNKEKEFKTSRMPLHLVRGLILFAAISMWCYGIANVAVVNATIISFTIPIFVLILAPIFLGEKVTASLWVATLICFLGVIQLLDLGNMQFSYYILIMLGSAFLFATLDIINKRFVQKESIISMLFYSNLFTLMFSLLTFSSLWIVPSALSLALLFLLGISANLILYCILKAFSYINASELAPYRYLELIITAALGYIIFSEIPSTHALIGAMVIIPVTLYIARKRAV